MRVQSLLQLLNLSTHLNWHTHSNRVNFIIRPEAPDTWTDKANWPRRSISVTELHSPLCLSRKQWVWCKPSQSSSDSVTSDSTGRWEQPGNAQWHIWPSRRRLSLYAPGRSGAGNRGHPESKEMYICGAPLRIIKVYIILGHLKPNDLGLLLCFWLFSFTLSLVNPPPIWLIKIWKINK